MSGFFPITSCKTCGAKVRRMDDRLYRLDRQEIHVCAAGDDGTPLTLYATPAKP